jgi:phage terminase large subunit GpA-like protein
MLIDSGGDRTNEVYEFSRRDPRILPTKGMSRPGVKLFYDTSPSRACGCGWWTRTTSRARSGTAGARRRPDEVDAAPRGERAVLPGDGERVAGEGQGEVVWKENGTARNEAWDCEVLQRAAAEMFNVASAAPMATNTQALPRRSISPTRLNGQPNPTATR